MNTRKFTVKHEEKLKGLIFISDNNELFPKLKTAAFIPFEIRGAYEDGDLEHISRGVINDIFNEVEPDKSIQDSLLRRAGLDFTKCKLQQIGLE